MRREGTDIIKWLAHKVKPKLATELPAKRTSLAINYNTFSSLSDMETVLAILLAGGSGERLAPLTQDTAKPAVCFGGVYRIIDFTLSNCINSDLRRIFILTQYKSLDLIRHIRDGWNILSPELGEFIETIPPMKRLRADWYLGTADAVFQNSQSIAVEQPALTLILAADQIYKMNYREMVDWHHLHHADITIATIQVAPEEAYRFGIAEIEPDHRIVGFEEKPRHSEAARSVFNPEMVSASDGHLRFQYRCSLAVCCRRTPRTRHPPTISARTFFPQRSTKRAW